MRASREESKKKKNRWNRHTHLRLPSKLLVWHINAHHGHRGGRVSGGSEFLDAVDGKAAGDRQGFPQGVGVAEGCRVHCLVYHGSGGLLMAGNDHTCSLCLFFARRGGRGWEEGDIRSDKKKEKT